MTTKHSLSQEQKERLLKTLKEHENPQVREKVLILLLLNDGKTYQQISEFLNIAYPTVAYWAVHGDPDNLESFLDGTREGNFHKVTEEYDQQLLNAALAHVARYGHVGRPYTGTGLDSPADLSRFIQAMRENGFTAQAQEELIQAFQEAKRQIEDKWYSYF